MAQGDSKKAFQRLRILSKTGQDKTSVKNTWCVHVCVWVFVCVVVILTIWNYSITATFFDLDTYQVLNEQLIQEAMLPGLRCLRQDLASTAPEHEEVVSSMIRDYEAKLMARPERLSQKFSSNPSFVWVNGTILFFNCLCFFHLPLLPSIFLFLFLIIFLPMSLLFLFLAFLCIFLQSHYEHFSLFVLFIQSVFLLLM